jgi:hypothetical protein
MKWMVIALGAGLVGSVHAQTQNVEWMVERNIRQQQRIENGLASGALETQEAARLQREQAMILRMQAEALADGVLTVEEADRVRRAQDWAGQEIRDQKHDGSVADPDSASNRRLRHLIGGNIRQQERILHGLRSGRLDGTEMASLLRTQARSSRAQARAAADGWVDREEMWEMRARRDLERDRRWGAEPRGEQPWREEPRRAPFAGEEQDWPPR